MNYRFPFFLMLLCVNPAWADFSNTKMWFHPLYIEDEPFILDFRGEWPDDCHPGEQKPVITEYTGDSVLIEFETIVEHVTCNDVPTTYRVLVDMSDVLDDVPGSFPFIDVTMRYGDAEFVITLEKFCGLRCDPPPPPRDIKPEPGLYGSDGLEKQGILLARQNDRMGVYPLVYDETGNSQWLFGGGGIVEDVYFTRLKELSGGQCLGCPPPDDAPAMDVVGKLTMLMDSQGVIQVKVNDGLFTEYTPTEFGYGEFWVTGGNPMTGTLIPNLTGRWAFSDNDSLWSLTTPSPTSVLPLVFDVVPDEASNQQTARKDKNGLSRPELSPAPPASVSYSVFSIEGDLAAEMVCGYRGEMICDLKNPDFTDFDHWYEIRMLSLERMIMTNMAEPGEGEGVGAGIAVRID